MRTVTVVLRWALTLIFLTSGVLHFLRPEPFLAIMPKALPAPLLLVQISGACEIAGAVGLQLPRLRVAAAWGLVLLLVAVFPANINQAVNQVQIPGHEVSPAVMWGRLPIQLVLIWAAWLQTRKP